MTDANGSKAPTALSLFSGIGGLDYGLSLAGFRHVGFCESDEWRRSVLAARWPGVPVWDDIRDVGEGDDGSWSVGERVGRRALGADGSGAAADGALLGPARPDLLCGGFPCQDVSVAGQRRGLAGARSGLFHEFARIAESLRPRWLLVENVPGLLSSQGGRDFGVVLATLADIGYGVAWRIVDSRYFGVPQRRRRVFIVGTLAVGDPRAAAERAGKILAVGASCVRHPPSGREAGPDTTVASLSGLGNGGPDDNDGQAGRLVASALVKRYGKGADSDATDTMVIADTVRSHPRPGSNSNGNLVAAPLMFGSSRGGPNSLRPGFTGDGHIVATSITLASDPISAEELAQPSTRRNGDPGVVQKGAMVRRLTPTECERLQALPDGWTNPDGKAPDSRRYAGLGDAVTASVGQWLGERLIALG